MKIDFDQKIAQSYDKWYETDFGKYTASAQNELMINLLKPFPGQRLLDIGCGTGTHLKLFGELGLDTVGLELSIFMLKKAKEKQKDKLELILAKGEEIPIKDNAFDFTILFTTLEFSQNPIEVLKEAGRVTKKKIFIGVLNSWSLLAIRRRVRGWFKPSIYNKAEFYNICKLKKILKISLIFNSLAWGGVGSLPSGRAFRTSPFLNTKLFRWLDKRFFCGKNPFASFLGALIELQ
ncbi:MAG: methyltransferase domain-containing protein [candidate division Zixibacteria bacterium]|nr:methyltransferase domain-containing protein [candidate division Zixibacteria bacterium]